MSRRSGIDELMERLLSSRNPRFDDEDESTGPPPGYRGENLLRMFFDRPSSSRANPMDRYDEYRNRDSRERFMMGRSMRPFEKYRSGFDPDEDREYARYNRRKMRLRRNPNDSDDSPERKPYVAPMQMPTFKFRRSRSYIDIIDLFKRSVRNRQERGIIIFLRGAPGTGKTYLAKLILDKERTIGNHNVSHLVVNQFLGDSPDKAQIEKAHEDQLQEFKDLLNKKVCKFIVVEVDGGRLAHLLRLNDVAETMGNHAIYLVELQNRFELCLKYGKARYRTNDHELKRMMEEIEREPPPDKFELLDASLLYQKYTNMEWMLKLCQKSASSRNYSIEMHKIDTKVDVVPNPFEGIDSTDLSALTSVFIKNPEILQMVQSSFTGLSLDDSESNMNNSNLESCKTFSPKTTVEYNHKRKVNDDDKLFMVHVRTIIDYDHRPSPKLLEVVEDVEVEAVMRKSRGRQQREKVLLQLSLAENPEDTVSNPNYPNNWESLSSKHPKSTGKRRKINNQKLSLKTTKPLSEFNSS